MADIFYNGHRINNVTHIGYDPGSPGGDHTSIAVRKPDGQIIFVDEASTINPKIFKKLNRQIERGKYIGNNNLRGKLRYRWAKHRGRVHGNIWVASNPEGKNIIGRLRRKS